MTAANATFVVADVAQAHDGSLGILHSYIDAVARTGVDAIKFQTHIADAESSPLESFRIPFSYVDATRQDYWRRMEFSIEQWAGIKQHCDSSGIEFMSTPSCLSAVEMLERVGVRRYKIGSGDTENRLLLDRVARTGKPILLSTGVSTLEEIDETVGFLSGFGNDLVIMQCTSEYPVAPERVGLNQIAAFRERYKRPVGLSDHSGTIFPSLAAVALGAACIETHVVFDKRMFGPDTTASLTVDDLSALVMGVRFIEKAVSPDFVKGRTPEHARIRNTFGKTLSVNRDMRAGETISFDDLESKKPAGQGISAADYADVIGKTLRRDMTKWDFLRVEDLA